MEGSIFGVSVNWFVMITLFWCIVAMAVFGIGALSNELVVMSIVFFTLGTVLLIGQFGWQVLILPSLAIISVVGLMVWRVFRN
jgi:hypothetical protein